MSAIYFNAAKSVETDRFASTVAVTIKLYIDEISTLLEKRGRLRSQIHDVSPVLVASNSPSVSENLNSFVETVKLFIDEIAGLLEERRVLRNQIRAVGKRARAIGLSSKVIRQVAQLRAVDREAHHEELELLALYKAADGWNETIGEEEAA